MPELRTLAFFMAAALALNLTPGPDMLYVAARGSSEGRDAGMVSALGIAAGCLVHTVALALGLSALLAAVPLAYDVVRYAGAGYLVYLGARALLAPTAIHRQAPLQPTSLRTIFRQGVITNILNPKVALFFLAFLPQFIDADAPAKALAFLALGCLFNFNSLFVNVPVAWLAARAGRRARSYPRAARWLTGALGALFVLLAARLATLERG